MPRLLDPGVRDPGDVLSRRFVQRPPEIVGGRVRLGVTTKIDADAFTEDVLAEIALDHPQHGGALRV